MNLFAKTRSKKNWLPKLQKSIISQKLQCPDNSILQIISGEERNMGVNSTPKTFLKFPINILKNRSNTAISK